MIVAVNFENLIRRVCPSNDCGVMIEKYQKVAEHASSECSKENFINLVAKSSATGKQSLIASHGIIPMHESQTESRGAYS